MNNQTLPLARREELVVQQLKDEILIYDLRKDKAFCLNETSAMVWQMCDGTKSVAEISEQLSKKLKQTASEDLVWLAIASLKKENLLSNPEEIVPDFKGMTRREVIRRVGLSTMLAIPVILSMPAPAAAIAGSPVVAVVCANTNCSCAAGVNPGVGNTCADVNNDCPRPNCTRCLVSNCFLPGGEGAIVCQGVCAA